MGPSDINITVGGANASDVQLSVAGSIWGNNETTFKPGFEKVARSLDFESPKSVDVINSWVRKLGCAASENLITRISIHFVN